MSYLRGRTDSLAERHIQQALALQAQEPFVWYEVTGSSLVHPLKYATRRHCV